jgi:hypothetical protein
MISARVGRCRPGGAEKRFLINRSMSFKCQLSAQSPTAEPLRAGGRARRRPYGGAALLAARRPVRAPAAPAAPSKPAWPNSASSIPRLPPSLPPSAFRLLPFRSPPHLPQLPLSPHAQTPIFPNPHTHFRPLPATPSPTTSFHSDSPRRTPAPAAPLFTVLVRSTIHPPPNPTIPQRRT